MLTSLAFSSNITESLVKAMEESTQYHSEQHKEYYQNNKEEIIVAGAKEKFAILVKRFAPGLFSKFISNNKLA